MWVTDTSRVLLDHVRGYLFMIYTAEALVYLEASVSLSLLPRQLRVPVAPNLIL